ncbi:MAG: hypothetical protein JNL25_10835 [Rhodospirillaceae bacterium]|nr:hypothetical protein [Rhodospirillaceae bacterium]
MNAAGGQNLPPPLLAAIERCRSEPGNIMAAGELGGLFHDYGMTEQAEHIRHQLVGALATLCGKGAPLDTIFNLLQMLYQHFTKKVETEQYARTCFQAWQDSIVPYARKFQDPVLPRKLHAPLASRPWRIGFLLQNAVILGHTDGMLEVIANRPHGLPWADQPIVYTLFGDLPALNERVRGMGAEIVNMAQNGSETVAARIVRLRRRIAEDGITHLVWVSAPTTADFVLAMRLAPVQLFWTLKFHPFRIPEVDGYISYGGWSETRREVHGEEWQVVPFLLARPSPPVAPEAVAAARARFAQHPVLFGALARTEKLNSPPYLAAVAEILRANPTAGYLWTGREPHDGIQRFFTEAGVAAQTHFIGWVDTTLYAQVLDIFLETFPFGCGVTAMQALVAGTPLLSFAAPETQYGMHFFRPLAEAGPAAPEIRRLLAGENGAGPLLYAADAAQYVEFANRLARDATWRRGVGQAGRDYYQRYLADSSRMSHRFHEVVAATMKPDPGA